MKKAQNTSAIFVSWLMLPIISISIAGAVLGGCEKSPVQPQPPAPDLVIGETLFDCSWEKKPAADEVVADVILEEDSLMPAGPASQRQEDVLIARGARILYRFHVPALRVRIPTDSLPVLEKGPNSAMRSLSVPNPEHHDLELWVTYRAGPTDRDREDIAWSAAV